MDSEIYMDNDTWIHRLDPRTKIFTLLTFFVLILYFQNPLWTLPLFLLLILEGYLSHTLRNLMRLRQVMIVLCVAGLVMFNFFSTGPTPLFWVIKLEPFLFGIDRTLLILSMIIAGMVFMSITRTEELINGMIGLGLPFPLGFAIGTSLRLVPTIMANVSIIGQAQRSRGLDLDRGSILERIKKYIPVITPVFISTIRNTNIFSMALESKGFGARPKRSFYMQLRYRRADYLILAFLLVLFIVCTFFVVEGYGQIPGLIQFSR